MTCESRVSVRAAVCLFATVVCAMFFFQFVSALNQDLEQEVSYSGELFTADARVGHPKRYVARQELRLRTSDGNSTKLQCWRFEPVGCLARDLAVPLPGEGVPVRVYAYANRPVPAVTRIATLDGKELLARETQMERLWTTGFRTPALWLYSIGLFAFLVLLEAKLVSLAWQWVRRLKSANDE